MKKKEKEEVELLKTYIGTLTAMKIYRDDIYCKYADDKINKIQKVIDRLREE